MKLYDNYTRWNIRFLYWSICGLTVSPNHFSKSVNISESSSIINFSFKSAFVLSDCILELLLNWVPYRETFSNAFISSVPNVVLILFFICDIFFVYLSIFFVSFCSHFFNETWVDFNSLLNHVQSIYLSTCCNSNPFSTNFVTW